MANDPQLRVAVAGLDKVLAAHPKADSHTLSVVAHELSLLRDKLAARQREVGATAVSRRRLEHVNAAISVVMAAHFPLGGVPWAELDNARNWLTRLLRETEV